MTARIVIPRIEAISVSTQGDIVVIEQEGENGDSERDAAIWIPLHHLPEVIAALQAELLSAQSKGEPSRE